MCARLSQGYLPTIARRGPSRIHGDSILSKTWRYDLHGVYNAHHDASDCSTDGRSDACNTHLYITHVCASYQTVIRLTLCPCAQVTLEHSGQQFTGSNPTAAVVAAALAQGSSQYVSGVKVRCTFALCCSCIAGAGLQSTLA